MVRGKCGEYEKIHFWCQPWGIRRCAAPYLLSHDACLSVAMFDFCACRINQKTVEKGNYATQTLCVAPSSARDCRCAGDGAD